MGCSFHWNLISKLSFSLRSGEKYWVPWNVWNLLKVLLPHTVLIHYSSQAKHPSKSDYSSKKSKQYVWRHGIDCEWKL